jgi:hypothetical protein
MRSHDQDQPVSKIDFDVTLDIRSLRARVEFEEGLPSLVFSDGTATVQISTGLGGPSVRDLIPVGRLVASTLRFQTVCNRFTRSARRPAPTTSAAEGETGEEPTTTSRQVPDRTQATAGRSAHRYTLHLDFITDDGDAMAIAAALADGLAVLRPEVDAYTARLSVPGIATDPQPLFCATTGPEGAVCGDFSGHTGWHAEAGPNGLRWGEGDGDGTRG